MRNIPTPHLEAKLEDIAENVIMPGDPLRAKFIAENFLSEVKCINSVRNNLGYTGKYNGKKVSVIASGMGMPSIGIYSYELFNFYGVDQIIRVGTAGSLQDNIKLKDIVVAVSASTDSNYINQFNLDGAFAPSADFELLTKSVELLKKKNLKYHLGNVLTTDTFYSENLESMKKWQRMNVLAVEMETSALYINAAIKKKKALSILTISDYIFNSKESLTSKEREKSLTDMIEIALNLS